MAKKPDAKDKTVGLFDGKTDQEKADEAERIRTNADLPPESARGPAETIEQASDRWRAMAFAGQEFVTKHFNDPDATANQYRLTDKNGWLFLEKQGMVTEGKEKGPAYSWAGLMFPADDLFSLAEVFVAAARARKSKVR